MSQPIFVLTQSTKRETGRKAQLGNIAASKAVADIIRTCLGPKAMLKMMLDPMGGITLTNDGNAILREIDVVHPAAKSMIELSKTQDEEVGDGTTSVIILAAEFLLVAQPHLQLNIHPTVIIRAFFRALEDSLVAMSEVAVKVNLHKREELLAIVKTAIGTKFVNRWSDLMCNLAIDAVQTVAIDAGAGTKKEIDIKRYVKIERIAGGDLEDSEVLAGVVLNKDVLHSKMRRYIENPRIILLDCGIEPKKLENAAVIDVNNAEDWNKVLKQEEDFVKAMCDNIIKHKPDLVITEKGLSDLAQHYFVKNNVTCLRRLRKTDNNRIARATGATIVNRPEEIQESDVGTQCGLFEVRKIGDEYWSYLVKCKDPKACTIILRGGSRDVLKEVERNLDDAMCVARNILLDPRLVPGGGATEMAIAHVLTEKGKSIEGIQQGPYLDVAKALEVIPRTLAQNCGSKTIRVITELRAKHAGGAGSGVWGVDGNKGVVADVTKIGVWDPFAVKAQTIKTAIEAACLLLRVDDIVSGMKGRKEGQ